MKRNQLSNKVVLLAGTAVLATCKIACGQTYSGNAAYIENLFSGTANVTYSSSPVITAIGSAPGTVDGYTYSAWSFLAQDSTGSLDIYGTMPAGFTPAVGNSISATGTYSPYHQIPELETLTAASTLSTGNTLPTPATYTIPQLTASGTGPIPEGIAGYLVSLDNVTLYNNSAATTLATGNFATHANVTLYAKDGNGNIMEVYVWASSYSADGAFGGTPIPQGPVDLTGFVSQSSTFPPEFTPFSITSVVPEPSVLSLLGFGGVGSLAYLSRFKKKA